MKHGDSDFSVFKKRYYLWFTNQGGCKEKGERRLRQKAAFKASREPLVLPFPPSSRTYRASAVFPQADDSIPLPSWTNLLLPLNPAQMTISDASASIQLRLLGPHENQEIIVYMTEV